MLNKFCVGDILLNTQINHIYRVTSIKDDMYVCDIYVMRGGGWQPSKFEWFSEEVKDWVKVSPVTKAIYED